MGHHKQMIFDRIEKCPTLWEAFYRADEIADEPTIRAMWLSMHGDEHDKGCPALDGQAEDDECNCGAQ